MNKNQEGFTLIEVLISITILSFLMTYVYQIVDSSSRAKDTITVEDRQLLDIELALNRIDIDFSQIHSPLYYSPQYKKPKATNSSTSNYRPNLPEKSENFPLWSHFGKPVPNKDSPDKSEFIFMTNSNRRRLQDIKQGRNAWIKYSLDSEETSRGGYQLIRQFSTENVYTPEHDWGKVDSQVLLKHLKSFIFEYWDPGKRKWASSIKELNNYSDTLKLIRVKIEWVDTNEVISEIVRTYRVLWPEYDPYQDELIYKKALEGDEKEIESGDKTL